MMRNDHLFMFSSDMEQLSCSGSLTGAVSRPPAATAPVAATNHQRIFPDDVFGSQMKNNCDWIRTLSNSDEEQLLYPLYHDHLPYEDQTHLPSKTPLSSLHESRVYPEEAGPTGAAGTSPHSACEAPRGTGPLEQDLCAGCGSPIVDRYYLVTVNHRWHTTCLSCHHCKQSLDLHLTCFVKDGDIYCKDDYCRLFAPKRCSRCQQMVSGQELVIRVQADDIYHVDCFVCSVCQRQLRTGDRFGVRNSLVFCQLHYGMLSAPGGSGGTDGRSSNQTTVTPDEVLACSPSAFSRDASSSFSPPPSLQAPPLPPASSAVIQRGSFFNGSTALHKGRPRKRKMVSLAQHESIDIFGQKFGDLGGYDISDVDLLNPHQGPCSFKDGCLQSTNRQKRMRTSFKHHQLRTMKAYFALNHNPDAKDLKELAQKTGLTKRVLQVWFQNARAKYRRNVLKQEGDTTGTTDANFNNTTSSSALDDVIVDSKTLKLSNSRRNRSPSQNLGLSDSSATSPENETLHTPGTLLEMDQSTSSSTLLEMFDPNYIRAN